MKSVVSKLGLARAACTISAMAIATLVVPVPAQSAEKLVIASFYPVDKVSGWDGLMKAVKAKYGDIDIEIQVTPFDQYLPKLLSQIAGGDAPDIAAVENTPFPQFAARKLLEDLTPYLEKTKDFNANEFFPSLLDRYTIDGKVYGIPYDAQPFGLLFYNPKAFTDAGVKAPTNDWTWEDMRKAAAALTNADKQTYGLCLSNNDINNWQYFLYSGGAGYVNDPKAPTKSEINSAAAMESSQFYVDLMNKDKSVPSFNTMTALGGADQNCPNLFLHGKAAMMLAGAWKSVENPQAFADLGVKVVMGPVKDLSKRVYPTGGTAYAILRSSNNKELAWKFITEFLGKAGYEAAYSEAKLGAIYPPAYKPSFDWYAKQKITFVDTLQPNADMLNYVRFAPYTQNWAELQSKCITPNLASMLQGEADVKPTLDAMSQCIDGSLAN